MQVKCLVHRIDETDVDGVLFNGVREAYDHILERASNEGKQKEDYTIVPIEIEEPVVVDMSANMVGQGGL